MNFTRKQRPGDDIDATPGGDDDRVPPPPSGGRMNSPRNLPDTKAWKQGVSGAKSVWSGYLSMMAARFQSTPRLKQDEYILRMSQIVTIGSAALVLSFGYPFLPTFARVLILPVVLVGAWLVGSRVVAPTMVARFEKHLNPYD